jgi:hypothetical protein
MRALVIMASLFLLAATAMLLPDLVEAQTDPPSSGDWTVSDRTFVENRTVQLRGNLTVANGGHLTLRNVTLQMFSSLTEAHGITVRSGGTLQVMDNDGNQSTQGDRSVLMRGSPSFGYYFVARQGSNLLMTNSLVSGPGARPVARGVLVETDNATFAGVSFVDGDLYCLRIQGSSGPRVLWCSFYLADNGLMLKDAVNVSIFGCELMMNSKAGLLIDNSTNTTIFNANCSYNNLDGMFAFDSKGIWVYDSVFSENTNGIVIKAVDRVLLDACQVNTSTFNGIVATDHSTNVSLVNCTIFDVGRSGIQGEDLLNLSLDTCVVRDCTYFGIRLLDGVHHFEMVDSHVTNNGYDGVHVDNAMVVRFEGNVIGSNGYNGLFIINTNGVSVMDDEYHSNGYDGLNCDNVRGLAVEGLDSHENQYNGIYLKAGTNGSEVIDSTLWNNTRCGIYADSAFNILVQGCNISGNLDYGIRVESGAYNITMYSCQLLNNAIGGVKVRSSQGLRAYNLDIIGGGGHVAVDVEAAGDVWVMNSTLMGFVVVDRQGNATIVSPLATSFITQVTGGSWLDLAYWVEVEVVWPDDRPVVGALVNVTSVNGSRRHSVMTDDQGTTGPLPVTIRTWEGWDPIERNPTTFRAQNGTEWAGRTLSITADTTVRIVLEDITPPVPVMGDVWAELGNLTVMDGSESYDNGLLTSWAWRFSDGVGTVDLVGPTASWTFTVLGDFHGVLNVTDSAGLSNETTFTIHVVDTTPPRVAVGEDALVNQHTQVELNGTGTTDNDSTLILTGTFLWSIYKGSATSPFHTSEGPFEAYIFDEMGEYLVVLRVTDQSGNSGNASFLVTVRDNTPPSVDAGPDIKMDQGETVTLAPLSITDNDPGFEPSNASIRWRIKGTGMDVNLTGRSVEWTPPEMGEYQAFVYVTDASGNVGNDLVVVTVLDTSQPVVDLGEDRTVNVTSTVTLDARGTRDNDPSFPAGATYSWTITGPQLVLERYGIEVSFKVPWVGIYTVTLSVTDATGNMGGDTLRMESVDPWAPAFGPFHPLPEHLSDHGDVIVTVTMTDQGTGVNPDLVEMRMRMPSDDVWGTWTVVDVGDPARFVEATIHMELPEGTTLIQFRCWDLAGNGPVLSPEHPVRVNSRPTVVVLSPTDGADYGPYDEIWLDASPTHDPDVEDVLTFLWTSDIDGPRPRRSPTTTASHGTSCC